MIFRKKKSQDKAVRDYLKPILSKAFTDHLDVSLYIIGQYNYTSQDQVESILSQLIIEDYDSCKGFHDSQMINDIIVIYLATSRDVCRVLVVLDPVEIFDNPILLGSVEVNNCSKALMSTIQKVL